MLFKRFYDFCIKSFKRVYKGLALKRLSEEIAFG